MRFCLFLSFLLLGVSCQNAGDYSPKPRGYHRIVFPEKKYNSVQDGCAFGFEIPEYAVLTNDKNRDAKPCWNNLDFPNFNARLHISYYPISSASPFDELTEDARSFAFKHTSKATMIEQKKIHMPEHQIYGLEYLIDGNTASNFQFYVSDSTKHYVRGALYFNEKPNLDSIQPVLEYIKADIEHLIHTFRWK